MTFPFLYSHSIECHLEIWAVAQGPPTFYSYVVIPRFPNPELLIDLYSHASQPA